MSIDALFEQANPQTASASITIRRPDDWHVHLRDGDMLKAVAGGGGEILVELDLHRLTGVSPSGRSS